MATMSILDLKEFAETLDSYVSTTPMSTSSRPVLGTPRLQGEGGFSLMSKITISDTDFQSLKVVRRSPKSVSTQTSPRNG